MGVGFGVAAGGVCAAGGGVCVVGGVWAMALPAAKTANTAKTASVIVCLLMSGLYLHLSKGNDNVERAAEASPGKLVAMRLARGLAALMILVAFTASTACDDPGPTTPDDPDPDPTNFTETFSGVLNKNGALTFPFNATASGTATATLASILPDNTLALGFAMGTWNGQACQSVISNDNAIEFTTLTGTVGSAGALCLRIYDIGRIATTTKFTITVVHP